MIKDLRGLIDQVCKELRDFTDVAVVGMSGGADSTLVTTLCMLALEPQNVYGAGMPYNDFDKQTFNTKSRLIAEKLGIRYQEIAITNPVDSINNSLIGKNIVGQQGQLSGLNHGNLRSRIRMVYLYTLNQYLSEVFKKRCRVIGTGNLSEDYIGYDTKGGDALADIFPIGSLFKSEVYQLLDYLVERGYLEENMINRVPSAGLEDGQTDESDLGYTYDEMEPVIKMLTGTIRNEFVPQGKSDLVNFVARRHKANAHKHEAVPVIDLGDFR